MNGLAVLKLLRQSSLNNTAVVMLSHSNDEELALECIEAGAQDFISKSEVTASRLMRAILHAKERNKIEQQLLDSHEKLRTLAELDSLTGLANRYMFEGRLNAALPLAKREGNSLALLMLDLDKFKNINDTLGHVIGDLLLVEVAKRIMAIMREGDLLCRLGGDEFAILVYNLVEPSLIRSLTERILNSLTQPLVIEEHNIVISASIGIASFPECATDVVQLMKCADAAMYRSKESGRNQAHFYSRVLHQQTLQRVELERELHQALSQQQFVLYYQPQIDAQSEKICGVEALIRWQHPTKGLLGPVEFIAIAEDIGLIEPIGRWVIETACAQLQQWQHQYKLHNNDLLVAVNLSALQLGNEDFVQHIEQTLLRCNIAPACLELELTESALIKNVEHSSQQLHELSSRNVQLALDDFGTGYSSLLQLQKYPFGVLKIDKSFIQPIFDQNTDAIFLKAINRFAKTLGLLVVAEGVETQAQKNWCQQLQFDRIQGYYYAKPMDAESLAELLLNIEQPLNKSEPIV